MLDFYNSNEVQGYPFLDSESGNGIADTLLVDLKLSLPSKFSGLVHMTNLVVTPSIISFGIVADTEVVAVVTVPYATQPYKAYPLHGISPGVSGYVVFGRHNQQPVTMRDSLLSLDGSTVDLDTESTITSISTFGTPTLLEGVVRLRDGGNVIITGDMATSTITFTLSQDLITRCVGMCENNGLFDACGLPPVRTINGVAPDANGRITLEVVNNAQVI